MTASQVIQAARAAGITGALVRIFSNGQELRHYMLTINGEPHDWKIRAFPHEHA